MQLHLQYCWRNSCAYCWRIWLGEMMWEIQNILLWSWPKIAPWYFQPMLQCHAMESPSSWCHLLLLPSVRPAAHHGLSALFFPKLRVFNRIPTAADSKHQILPAPVQLPTKFLILFSSSFFFFPHFALERAQSAHSFHQAHSSIKRAGGI